MRHLISGAARARGQDLPAPEENGRNTRTAAAPQTAAVPDADVDLDDVASDGLDQPAAGVGSSLEDPAEPAPTVRGASTPTGGCASPA